MSGRSARAPAVAEPWRESLVHTPSSASMGGSTFR